MKAYIVIHHVEFKLSDGVNTRCGAKGKFTLKNCIKTTKDWEKVTCPRCLSLHDKDLKIQKLGKQNG